MGLRPEFERLRTEESPVSDWSRGGDFMGESTWLKVDAAWILHLCTPLQQHLSYGYPSHCLLEKFITTEGTPDYWEASLWAVRKLPGLKSYAVELFCRNHQAYTSVVLDRHQGGPWATPNFPGSLAGKGLRLSDPDWCAHPVSAHCSMISHLGDNWSLL